MVDGSKFKGIALVPKDVQFPEAGFLEGKFGKEVLEEYQGRVKADFNGNSRLNVLSYSNGVVKGSNPFAVVLVNSILPEDMRTATPADLEKALQAGMDLRGTYTDSALVLRDEDNPNSYLAKDLMKQVRHRKGKKAKMPVMIPLNGLDVVNDSNSDYGLAFKLREDAQITYAPILNKPGNFTSEDINPKTGLPKKTGEGNRTLYTRDSGLSRLYLNDDLGLDSGNSNLDNSSANGRVVVVSGEATSQKIEPYIANLRAEADKAKNEYVAKLNGLKAQIDSKLKKL